jgi:hypothetical protein
MKIQGEDGEKRGRTKIRLTKWKEGDVGKNMRGAQQD